MSRVFFFTFQDCFGLTGGGQGVVYRLYQANKKYNLFKEVYFVFNDRVIHNTEDIGKVENKPIISQKNKNARKYIPGIVYIIKKKIDNKRRMLKLREISETIGFTKDDIFIFHDYEVAYPFIREFQYDNVILVYHMQGGIYNEWCDTWGRKSGVLHAYYNKILKGLFRSMKYICFPSKGALEALTDNEPEICKELNRDKIKYLYNGVSCEDQNINPVWLEPYMEYKGIVFATVAALNSAKAVERIPKVLGKLKDKGYEFKWFLVGDGVKSDEVSSAIDSYDIKSNTIWIRNRIRHEEVLSLFKRSDFYIILHKYSIFDLSTLEAMHYGCIPVLSYIGGNKEVIIDENGLFIDEESGIEDLERLIKTSRKELKEKNIRIQEMFFSEEAFINKYHQLCMYIASGL